MCIRDSRHLQLFPVPGRGQQFRLLFIAIGEHLCLTKAELLSGIAAYRPVGSRMHLVRCGGGRIIR